MKNRSGRFWVQYLGMCCLSLVVLIGFRDQLGLLRASAGWNEESVRLAVTAVQNGGRGDEQDEPRKGLSKFMRQKLEASSTVLEGLCTEDLELVTKGSKVLLQMSHEERWRVSAEMFYRRYSNEFSAAVEELLKESEDEDMDGTSLAWVNVTMKCLKCHEWVRGTVIAGEQ
ncbi:MAG: hypothetical protein ACKO2L_15565 [Planctomycetaceae bacterium]